MNAPCYSCGAVDPDEPCPVPHGVRSHTVGQCPAFQNTQMQMQKMDALEEAWTLMKAKKDAPNYRPCENNKCCGNCKAWDDSATKDPQTGYCEWYNFTCNKDYTCDAWAGK